MTTKKITSINQQESQHQPSTFEYHTTMSNIPLSLKQNEKNQDCVLLFSDNDKAKVK